MRQREDGACFAYGKNDSCFALKLAEYARLKADWMAGKAFFEGTAFYNSAIVLKLGDIVAISETAPEHMEAGRADKAQDKREDDREDAIP